MAMAKEEEEVVVVVEELFRSDTRCSPFYLASFGGERECMREFMDS